MGVLDALWLNEWPNETLPRELRVTQRIKLFISYSVRHTKYDNGNDEIIEIPCCINHFLFCFKHPRSPMSIISNGLFIQWKKRLLITRVIAVDSQQQRMIYSRRTISEMVVGWRYRNECHRFRSNICGLVKLWLTVSLLCEVESDVRVSLFLLLLYPKAAFDKTYTNKWTNSKQHSARTHLYVCRTRSRTRLLPSNGMEP